MRRAKMGDALRQNRVRLPFEVRPGQLVAVQDPDGRYAVMKVLAADSFAVHVRLYVQRFERMPDAADLSSLTLGAFGPGSGNPFSIGHMPLAPRGFAEDKPVLLAEVDVADDELDGYRAWLDANAI